MYSILKPDFIYDDVTPDITENDIDVVSDLWEMDGRDVYRGSRDPRYTHANVYWLYDEDLKRVGCSEHDIADHGNFRVLWFYDSEFGTLLQEDGWVVGNDIWSLLPSRVFDRAMNEGWTTPLGFLEQCLIGPLRIVTPDTLIDRPTMYVCTECKRRSLDKYRGCSKAEPYYLDYPQKEKVFFVDEDLRVHIPPPTSSVWSHLFTQPSCDGSSQPQVLVQEPEPEPPQTRREPSPPPAVAPHQASQQPLEVSRMVPA